MTEVLSRPETAKGRLQRAALRVWEQHRLEGALPTSNRFMFYELEQSGEASKRERRANVSEAFMRLREAGIIPWEDIVDETRTLTEWDSAETVADYLLDRLDEARLNPWDGPPPLILTESESLAGVLRYAVAYRYACPIGATRGQVNGFLRTRIGPLLRRNQGSVLYLGDYDHQGGQIEANTRRVLEKMLGRELDWRRIAITAEQVAERRLSPVFKEDRRYKPPRTHEAVETEALGQQVVVALVREALDELLPEPLVRVQDRENAQREIFGIALRKALRE